jgi:hypothetical protein
VSRRRAARSWRRQLSNQLEPSAATPEASPQDRKAMEELLAKGLLRAVIFATDDCDATFEQVRRAGAEVLQEPMDQG